MNLTLKIHNESPHPYPEYKHPGDSGFDLRAWIDNETKRIFLKPLERTLIRTGLYVQLPENTELQVRPRSGCALKYGLSVLNTPGTVDNNYRGEICIIAVNLSVLSSSIGLALWKLAISTPLKIVIIGNSSRLR
jgi:dUTP pyrophosphatase